MDKVFVNECDGNVLKGVIANEDKRHFGKQRIGFTMRSTLDKEKFHDRPTH